MKSTLKVLFVLPILVALTSCSIAQNLPDLEVADTYIYFPHFEFYYSMEILEDGTFKFGWKEGLSRGETIGIWYRKGAKLILSSKIQLPPKGPANYEIKHTSNTPSDSLKIKLLDDRGGIIPFVNVVLKKEDTFLEDAVTDMTGIARLSKIAKTNLTFLALGFKKVQFNVDPNLSYYEIELKQGDQTYKYFNEEVWRYRDGRLYPPKVRLKKISNITYFEKEKTTYTTSHEK